MAVGGVSAGADTLVTKKPVTAGGTSETSVAAGGAQVKATEGTGDKGLTAAEDKELKDGLTGTDKKDGTDEVEQGKSLDGKKELTDEELEKLAKLIADKIKQENDVEGLSKEGQAQKGTCCGGTTQPQASEATNQAQSEYEQALKNYYEAKANKTSADQNVKTAKAELDNAKNQKVTNADGTQTQDQNAISQAQAKYDQAIEKQKEAETKLQEAEKKLEEAKAKLEQAQGKQSDIASSISKAQTNYQNTYNAMLASGSTGSSFSLAA